MHHIGSKGLVGSLAKSAYAHACTKNTHRHWHRTLSSVRYATPTVLTFNTIPVRLQGEICKGTIVFGLLTTLQHNVSCIWVASGCAAGDCSCPCRPSCQTEAATPAVYFAATFGLPEDARWQVCVHSPHAHASEVQSLQGKVLATRPRHQRLSGSI